MSPFEIGLVGIGFFFILIFARMPVALAMAVVGFLGFSYLVSVEGALTMVGLTTYYTFSSYFLTVIPLFVWMGYIAFHSGISKRLYTAAYKVMGHLRGGLAMATTVACAAFGAVCGSSTATAATMAAVSLPEMKRYGYDSALSTATVAAGGTLGILIPPSIILIVYGIAVEQSIGRLFVATILPGVLQTILFIVTIYLLTLLNPTLAPAGPRVGIREKASAIFSGGGDVAVIFALVMGGFFAGLFTPTEAGAVGAGSVLVVALIRRQLRWQGFIGSMNDTIKTAVMVLFLVTTAMIFSRFIAVSGLPVVVSEWAGGLPLPPIGIMGIILLILLVLGCFIDALPLILMTLPIFFPLALGLGFDPIWFGVIIVLVVGTGVMTPPVGINVYVVSQVAKDVPIMTIFRGILPFLGAKIVCIVLLVAFPQIALFLPNLLW